MRAWCRTVDTQRGGGEVWVHCLPGKKTFVERSWVCLGQLSMHFSHQLERVWRARKHQIEREGDFVENRYLLILEARTKKIKFQSVSHEFSALFGALCIRVPKTRCHLGSTNRWWKLEEEERKFRNWNLWRNGPESKMFLVPRILHRRENGACEVAWWCSQLCFTRQSPLACTQSACGAYAQPASLQAAWLVEWTGFRKGLLCGEISEKMHFHFILE